MQQHVPVVQNFVYTDRSALPIHREFFEKIFNFMPWPTSAACQQTILGLLAKCMIIPTLGQPWMKERVCTVLPEFVVLSTEERAKFGFDPLIFKKMEFILKKTLTTPASVQAVAHRLTNASDRPLSAKFMGE
jgi:Fe2+ transport system protein B